MATREIESNIKALSALDIQAITTDVTTDGNVIDMQGFSSLEFILFSGTLTDGSYTPLIEESDEITFGGEETPVADSDLTKTEASVAFADSDDDTVKKIGYIGGKRFVRMTLVSASTSTGGTIGCLAIQGHPYIAPVS